MKRLANLTQQKYLQEMTCFNFSRIKQKKWEDQQQKDLMLELLDTPMQENLH